MLRVFEKIALRKMFRCKRDDVTRDRRRLGSSWSVLLTKCYAGNQISSNEMVGECSTCGGEERCVQFFGGET